MRKILLGFFVLMFMVSNSWATVGWNKSIPATSENPQAISPDVIENNTALDLMLQNYRDGYLTITLTSTSAITIGAGGVMLSNSGGSTRLMVANTSPTTMTSTNIDTGSISPSSTYYIYAYASSTTATTFSVVYSASSTSPTGITYYQKIGTFTTDGSSNFVSASSNTNTQVGLGSWVSESGGSGTYGPYKAATDGFCVAVSNVGGNMILYSDSSSSPSTIRSAAYQNASNYDAAISPVRKGDYYEVTVSASGTATVYFISLGS